MNNYLLPLSFFSRFAENFVFFFFGSILFDFIILFVIPGIIELFNKMKNKEKRRDKQKSKVNKLLVAILIVICFCLISSIDTIYKLYNIYVELETSYTELETETSELKEDLEIMEKNKDYWFEQYMNKSRVNDNYKNQADEANGKYEDLLTKYSELESEYNKLKENAPTYDGYDYLISINPTFNVYYYHTPSCVYINTTDSFALVCAEVAEKEGYKPCPLCITQ